MVDAHFGVPRLAQLHDSLDPVRKDLDAYLAKVAEFGADTVGPAPPATGPSSGQPVPKLPGGSEGSPDIA